MAEMKWQPIETAPKDGTPILCYQPGPYVTIYVVKWDDIAEPGWFEAAGEEYGQWEPTHWMPLPEPPQS